MLYKVWKGLSFNYNYQGSGANYLIDIPYLFSKGVRHLRLLICDYTDTSPTGIPLWKTILEYALTFDFETITIGLSSNPTTLTNLNKSNFTAAYTTPSTGFAYYLKAQNVLHPGKIICCVGNEEMYHRDGTLTDAQVRAFIRTHFAAIKAIIPEIPCTYSMANGEMFPYYNDKNSSALAFPWDGDPDDFASANLYSYPHGSTTSGTDFFTNLSSAVAWFGATLQISEFGPDPNGYSDANWFDKDFYSDHYKNQLLGIIDRNIVRAYAYNFMDSAFGAKSPNGTFRHWWYNLIGEQRPFNVGMV